MASELKQHIKSGASGFLTGAFLWPLGVGSLCSAGLVGGGAVAFLGCMLIGLSMDMVEDHKAPESQVKQGTYWAGFMGLPAMAAVILSVGLALGNGADKANPASRASYEQDLTNAYCNGLERTDRNIRRACKEALLRDGRYDRAAGASDVVLRSVLIRSLQP